MLIGSIADIVDPESVNAFTPFAKFIGHEVIALLISAVFSFFSLGFARGFKKVDSGVGGAIASVATQTHVNLIFFAWLVAALIRVATGSATVAMTTAAGIVAPVLAVSTGAPVELVVLATGAGSLILSHVNDAGFWMIKEFFGMSVIQTLKSWTVMETLLSVVGLIFILIVSVFV